MDPRLEEACHAGNLAMLHSLLSEEDKILLHSFSSSSSSSSSSTASIDHNPLHIAAGSLGRCTELANDQFASDLNPRGLSALHLASAHGHLEIVRLLISKVGSHLCLLKDKDGRLAIHIAAMKDRIDILEELIKACPESARALTCQNESILHLAVQFNSFDTLEYFFMKQKLEADGYINHELFNLKDDKGNTILHYAVARRQLQNVKLLLSKEEVVEVNAMNNKGLTALDVLLDSPREQGDLTLGEVIRAAGGKMAREVDPHQASMQTNKPRDESSDTNYSRPKKKTKKKPKVEDNYTPGQLMVVATLIATITFQSGLNPPGGFTQDDGSTYTGTHETKITSNNSKDSLSLAAGHAVLGSDLSRFLLFDMIGLFASLSIILLLICVTPRKKKMVMRTLAVIMWVAVFSTAITFYEGIYGIFPDSNRKKASILLRGWYLIFWIFMSSFFLRFSAHLLRKVGWWRKKEGERVTNNVRNGGCLLWFMRIIAVKFILLSLFCIVKLIAVVINRRVIW